MSQNRGQQRAYFLSPWLYVSVDNDDDYGDDESWE
jgi:hypothetical protein